MAGPPSGDGGQEAGAARRRTVVQVEPVKYRICLWYLGHDRITRDDAAYRCVYELQKDEVKIDAKPFKIPNKVTIPAEAPVPAGAAVAVPGGAVAGAAGVGGVAVPVPAGAAAAAGLPVLDTPNKKAAAPAAKGGDATNPDSDQKYRVMITDNHGMRSADSKMLGRPDGDNESKPTNYKKVDGDKKDWLPDISPAIPFRVVVRKFVGGRQQDMDASYEVVIEVKDPVEEFDQYDGQRRKFLEGTPAAPGTPAVEGFFTRYNRESKNPDPGDDNGLTWFQGMRTPSTRSSPQKPGVKAVDVLRKVEYTDPPKIDEAPAGNTGTNNVDYTKVTAATPNEEMNAKFELSLKEETIPPDAPDPAPTIKVGIADLAFCPPPIGGDNYRFLITLVDNDGKDVREREQDAREEGAGAKPTVEDDGGGELAHPYAYTTGRFIVWRRVNVKLVVCVNKTGKNDITWADATKVYKTAFIDLVKPDDPGGYFDLTAAHWIDQLGKVFTADKPALDAILTVPATLANPDPVGAVYRRHFFPKVLTDRYVDGKPAAGGKLVWNSEGLTHYVSTLARKIIELACKDPAQNIEPPGSVKGKKQLNTTAAPLEGFFLMLMRAPTPTSGLLGASFGDRMFYFVNSTSNVAGRAGTTNTFAHELGHALYLRHSHTMGQAGGGGGAGETATWTSAPAPPPAGGLYLYDGMNNNQLMDHDQADGYTCYMAYTSPDAPIPKPCAVCALTLRFYDRVKLQHKDRYMNQILSDLKTVQIVRGKWTNGGAPVWALTEPDGAGKLPDLPNNNWCYILVVGKAVTFKHYDGNNRATRLNITTVGGATWKAEPAGKVTVQRIPATDTCYKITGTNTGVVTFTFKKGDLSATATMKIV